MGQPEREAGGILQREIDLCDLCHRVLLGMGLNFKCRQISSDGFRTCLAETLQVQRISN